MALIAPVPAAEYDVRLYDPAGSLVNVITDYQALEYSKRVNEAGSWSITLDETNSRAVTSLFELDGTIEVQRSIPGVLDWYLDFTGLFRTVRKVTAADSGLRSFAASGPGLLDHLNRRSILYPEGSGFASKRAVAESVMKAYVRENATGIATVPNGRFVNGEVTGLSVQASTGAGLIWQGDRSGRGLLETLQGISLEASGVEFDIVGTGPGTMEFRTFAPYRGLDRRAPAISALGTNAAGNIPCVFSVAFGNLAGAEYSLIRDGERTVFIVLGTGQFGDRKVATATAGAAADSPWNDAEVVINSQNQTSVGLASEALSAAQRMQKLEEMSFNPIQIFGSLYGREYDWGDYVTVVYDADTQVDLRILGVTVQYSAGVETLSFEVAQPRDDHG